MRIGLFKRAASYLMDTIPILFILSILFSLFIGSMLQPDNYDSIKSQYDENQAEYFDTLEGYYEEHDDEIITDAELQQREQTLRDNFLADNKEFEDVIYTYYTNSVIYYYIGFTVVYLAYVLLTRGQTFGRKFLKIQLSGRVNLWTLFLRDILWKHVFWTFTFGIGFIIDWLLITFTRKRRTLRDNLTETYLSHAGVDYPF